MAELFFTYLRISFSAGIMILAVLLARPFLRKAPRNITCILWLLVAIRLLLPFQVESPLSLQPRQFSEPVKITDLTPQWTRQDQDRFTDMQPQLQEPLTDEQLGFQQPVADVQKEPQQSITDEQPQPTWNVEPETVFAAIWMSGGVCLLVYAAVSLIVLRHRVRDAIRCPDGVWESGQIADAFLLGYFRPRIYLPVGLEQRDRELIIAHERAHQSRGDQWWKLLGLICLSIHWYNPLVWLSYALLCRDIEVACDERVIRSMVLDERKFYSLALLNSGKRLSGLLAYPVAFGEISLKERIKSVLSYRKPRTGATVLAVTLTLAVAVCFMTIPVTEAKVMPDETVRTTEEVTESTAEATAPATAPTAPAETLPPETAPTEPVTIPTEPVTAPTEPATVPTEPTPTQPKPTTPAKPVPMPTEPTTPTEPKQEPTEPPATEPTPTEPTVPPQNDQPQITVVAEGEQDSGPVRWKVTSDGVLTIWGNQYLFERTDYPWTEYREQITKIVLEGGIRSIPKNAFRGMYKVTAVQLPKTVTSIGDGAFGGCTSLTGLTVPYQVKTLGARIFEGSAVNTITFVGEAPASVHEDAFKGSTAKVYYHGEYASWTADQLQSYGGTITWLPL